MITALRISLALWPPGTGDLNVPAGERISLAGRIVSTETGEDASVRITVRTLSSDSFSSDRNLSAIPAGRKVLCYSAADEDLTAGKDLTAGRVSAAGRASPGELCPGDIVIVSGEAGQFPCATNEGEFDRSLYYRTLGLSFCIYDAEFADVLRGTGPLNAAERFLLRCRRRLGESIDRSFGYFGSGDAGTIRAILLGEKQRIDGTRKDLFQDSGIGHVLVISGLHISLLGMGLMRLLRRAGIPLPVSAAASVLFILLYGRMTGSGASTVRAIVMFSLHAAALCIGRTYDLMTAAAVAGLLLCIPQPLWLLNSGFLFSFAAVTGIAVLAPLFPGKSAFLTVPAAVLPIHLWFRFEYPFWSSLLNIPVLISMPAILCSGFLAAVFGIFCAPAGAAAAFPAHLLLKIYDCLAGAALSLPPGIPVTGRPSAAGVWAYYLILLSLAAYAQKRGQDRDRGETGQILRKTSAGIGMTPSQLKLRRLWKSSGPVCLALPLAALLFLRPSYKCELCFLDVGQGDGIYVETRDTGILIDGGSSTRKSLGERVLEPFLKCRGTGRLDLALLTHEDYDHCSGIEELLEKMGGAGSIQIGAVALPDIDAGSRGERYHRIEELARKNDVPLWYYARGDVISCGDLQLHCLHPQRGGQYEDGNEGSGVFALSYGDFSALLTGDLEGEGEAEVVDVLREENGQEAERFTVLKAAHHGSAGASSEALLQCIDASYAVISCGRTNRYGHPAPETVGRLESAGMEILDTRTDGEIVFRTDGHKAALDVFIK